MTTPKFFTLILLILFFSTRISIAQNPDADLDLVAEEQASPYIFPVEIEAVKFPEFLKPQIQSFYWFNLGEYDLAQTYYDRTMGKESLMSNAEYQKFSKLKKEEATPKILSATQNEDVVMFNMPHHIPVSFAYLRELLPALKEQGFNHLTIEDFDEKQITSEGMLKIQGDGYHHETQFTKMLREALNSGFKVHGYGRSCDESVKKCNKELQQAKNIANLIEKQNIKKLLVLGGYDHINERTDHPSWGKAMAAEFQDLTGIDPFTIEQTEMLRRSSKAYDDTYRKPISNLQKPVVLINSDGTNWIKPGGDIFDLQVFHPKNRYHIGVASFELSPRDRVVHLDSLLKNKQELKLKYPYIVQLYIKEEWDTLEEQTQPYDVALISNPQDKDHHLIVPANIDLHLKIRRYEEKDFDTDISAIPMAATLVKGAKVFNEKTWKKRDFFIVDGRIRDNIEGTPTDTLNLENKYLTPGFAEGHTHNLDRTWQKYLIDQYLSEGTLYIQNLTSKSKGAKKIREVLKKQNTLKVNYANWGFTSTLGHPFAAYEPYAMGLRDASKWSKYADSIRVSRKDLYNSYAFVDEVSQLDSIWSKYLKTKPDLTKIYYFNEEGIDKQMMGTHGLRLEVAKAIIDSAHVAGLQVYTHVETRSDFEKMINAGVDAFGHMPGYGWDGNSSTYENYYLPDSTLYEAAKRGVIINPTAALAEQNSDVESLEASISFQNDLISRYRKMGGQIIVGSDWFGSTSSKIYDYYAKNLSFSPDALLHLISSETAMTIFPTEAIGQIADGFRADFLVFDQHPVQADSVLKPENVFIEGKLKK